MKAMARLSQQVSQDQAVQPQDGTSTVHVAHRARDFGPRLTTADVQRFIGSRSLKGTYEWIRRKGIVRFSNGTVSRADVEREQREPRKPRRMAAASLLNLRKRIA